MKKLFITILAVAVTTVSFAQEQSPKEKAQALNAVVTKAIDDNSDAMGKAITAKTPEEKEALAKKQYDAAYDGVKAAMECNVFDNQPDEKGKVKPKFKKSNANKCANLRNDLINGGLAAYNKKNYKEAERYFSMFVDSHNDALFADMEAVKNEQNFYEVTYYAALAAYFNKNYKKAVEYAKLAQGGTDATVNADALKLELSSYDGEKQVGEMTDDQLIAKYQEVYKAHPADSDIFGRYLGALYNAKKTEEADKVLADRLKADPNDLMANAYLGQNAQEAADKATDEATAIKKYDEAIGAYEKVLTAKPDFDAVKYNMAVCARAKGVLLKAQGKPYKDLLSKAKKAFQDVQAKDPEESMFKTKYILSTIDEL